jgi:hypothetical protein
MTLNVNLVWEQITDVLKIEAEFTAERSRSSLQIC